MFNIKLKNNKVQHVKALKFELENLVENFETEVAQRMVDEVDYLVEVDGMNLKEAAAEVAACKRAFEVEVEKRMDWLTKQLAAQIGVTPSNVTIH